MGYVQEPSRRSAAVSGNMRWAGALALVCGAAALVLPGVLPAAASAQQPAPAETSLVFDGVTVVVVERGKLLPAQRVVIAGNRITTMGAVGAVKVPKGAQVVNARGKYLIPGLWDMHVHPMYWVDRYYKIFLANGITGIRNAGSDDQLDTLVQSWREILKGTRVGPPRQLLTGAIGSYEAGMSSKAGGANFFKIYFFSYEGAALARRVGVPFGGHVSDQYSVIEASDSGSSIIDHFYSGKLNAICAGPRASVAQCQPVAERFRRNNTWWAPTLALLMIDTVAKDGRELAAPEAMRMYQYVKRFSAAFWADTLRQGNWLRDFFSQQRRSDSLPRPRGFFHVAHEVGLPILAGTDAMPLAERSFASGFGLHAELATYVAEGMTPLAALQTATLNPAKLLKGIDSLGPVAPGKLADLVLLDADPLTDITNTTTIRAVMANGRYFDRAALDQLLAEVRREGGKEKKP